MDDLLTTRQVIEILKVDRITVYRMLQDGRLKGVKIGQQWRFYQSEVDRLLGNGSVSTEPVVSPTSAYADNAPDPNFPTHCVQTIQDLFSDVSQISGLVIDMQGRELTQISHPSALYQLMQGSASAERAMRATWAEFAHSSRSGKFFTCFSGLNYVGAPILDNNEQIGVFLAGQFYWRPADPREEEERLHRLASEHHLPLERLEQAAHAIPVIPAGMHARVEAWPFSAARAVQSILHERGCFVERLQQIASLTQLS